MIRKRFLVLQAGFASAHTVEDVIRYRYVRHRLQMPSRSQYAPRAPRQDSRNPVIPDAGEDRVADSDSEVRSEQGRNSVNALSRQLRHARYEQPTPEAAPSQSRVQTHTECRLIRQTGAPLPPRPGTSRGREHDRVAGRLGSGAGYAIGPEGRRQ